MSKESDRLYNLLPAIYRIKDAECGEPLRALMAVIEEEMQALESDIDRLYDNWFIETCDEWVVPYIGDLLGVRGVRSINQGSFSQRAYVANTLAYRRRKGTALVLEQLARDITGSQAKAVEFFRLLGATQNLNHFSLARPAFLDLRNANQLQLLDGPFDKAAHTVDVRRISTEGGKYNIPNIGLFLWEMQSYFVAQSTPRIFKEGRYWFSPLGHDLPLLNSPNTEMGIDHLVEESNVPGTLRRMALYEDLEIYRKAPSEHSNVLESAYFGDQPVFQVFLGSEPGPVPSQEIMICNLQDWDSDRKAPSSSSRARVAVDPELGRLALREGVDPARIRVSYSYGFSMDMGGGPYNRYSSAEEHLNPAEGQKVWFRGVVQDQEMIKRSSLLRGSLREAITEWNDLKPDEKGYLGIIAIMDSGSYDLGSALLIKISKRSKLVAIAAGWPLLKFSEKPIDYLVPDGLRPHLLGDINIRGTAKNDTEAGGVLLLDGLLLEGRLILRKGNLGGLRMAHCTLVPDIGGINYDPSDTEGDNLNSQLEMIIDHCICGPIILPESVPSLSIKDSIIGNASGAALVAKGADLDMERCTIFGTVDGRSLKGSDCIYTDKVLMERRQSGCVRFSYLPVGSQTARRYRCQPDLALVNAVSLGNEGSIRARVAPAFISVHYDHLGYGQLSQTSADEIRMGAEDGSEMGAFSSLKKPQREASLRASLDEYLRFGQEAGTFRVK
jgi:hypothetical protein